MITNLMGHLQKGPIFVLRIEDVIDEFIMSNDNVHITWSICTCHWLWSSLTLKIQMYHNTNIERHYQNG